jgi:hypothetical protein
MLRPKSIWSTVSPVEGERIAVAFRDGRVVHEAQ